MGLIFFRSQVVLEISTGDVGAGEVVIRHDLQAANTRVDEASEVITRHDPVSIGERHLLRTLPSKLEVGAQEFLNSSRMPEDGSWLGATFAQEAVETDSV